MLLVCFVSCLGVVEDGVVVEKLWISLQQLCATCFAKGRIELDSDGHLAFIYILPIYIASANTYCVLLLHWGSLSRNRWYESYFIVRRASKKETKTELSLVKTK